MSRTLLLRLAATAAAAVCVPGAAHAAGWVASGPLTPPDRIAVEPQVAITPSGERVIAWVQALSDSSAIENVSVRLAPPGGDFGATQTFPGSHYSDLQLAAGADGTVALGWVDSSAKTIHIARRAPGQASFVDATPLAVPGGEFPSTPRLAVTRGDVFVAFSTGGAFDPTTDVWAAELPAGATVLQFVPGTATGGAIDHQSRGAGQPQDFVADPGIAADNGRVYVSWQKDADGSGMNNGTTTIWYAALTAGGTFGAPVLVDFLRSTASSATFVAVRVAAGAGHAYVAWQDELGGILHYQDVATGGATQSIPVDPTGSITLADVDGSGSLVVAGEGSPPGGSGATVYTAIAPAGAAAPPAVRLTPLGISRWLEALAVASDGTALSVVDRVPSNSDTFQFEASVRPPGGTFGGLEQVSGAQDGLHDQHVSAAAAAAPGGHELVLWASADHFGARNLRLHLSERDATPPAFSAIAVPAGATVGQRIALSAQATDALAGAAAISWDFGDGSQATGATVSHVYGAPGAAVVTVTATDSVGNSVSQTRVIAVAPASPPVDTTPPVIGTLSLSHSRFRVNAHHTAQLAKAAKRPKHMSRTAPAGSTIRLTLSERSLLAIEVDRRGRRGSTVVGTLVRSSAGPNAVNIAFSGRISTTALTPGTYSMSVTAIDGAGNRSRTRSARFTIVRG